MSEIRQIGVANFQKLRDACEIYINFLNSGQYNEDRIEDYEYQIFETAITCIYGDKIWKFINEKMS